MRPPLLKIAPLTGDSEKRSRSINRRESAQKKGPLADERASGQSIPLTQHGGEILPLTRASSEIFPSTGEKARIPVSDEKASTQIIPKKGGQ